MKTNKMMRIASVLLVAVLLTTCVISGTFAKYVTTDSVTDSARVAKWGVTIADTTDALGNVMFGDTYKNIAVAYAATDSDDTITVRADSEGTNVVAPGTNGILSAFDINGAPEVDVTVTYVATLDLGDNWMVDVTDDGEDNAVFYCPIVITVNGTAIDGKTFASADLFEAAVKTAIEDKTATYQTNADLSAVEDDVVVEWAWAFTGDDAKDTALGDAAAAGTAAEIELTVAVTITQVD